MKTYNIAMAERPTLHIRESKRHICTISLLQRATYDGMLPAPNAWTPLPGRETTTSIVNMIKKTGLVKDILKRGAG
jgi:hypothetical protein